MLLTGRKRLKTNKDTEHEVGRWPGGNTLCQEPHDRLLSLQFPHRNYSRISFKNAHSERCPNSVRITRNTGVNINFDLFRAKRTVRRREESAW